MVETDVRGVRMSRGRAGQVRARKERRDQLYTGHATTVPRTVEVLGPVWYVPLYQVQYCCTAPAPLGHWLYRQAYQRTRAASWKLRSCSLTVRARLYMGRDPQNREAEQMSAGPGQKVSNAGRRLDLQKLSFPCRPVCPLFVAILPAATEPVLFPARWAPLRWVLRPVQRWRSDERNMGTFGAEEGGTMENGKGDRENLRI